jgi:hypothetical protein
MVGTMEPGLDARLGQIQVACRLRDAHPSEFSQIDHDPEFLGNLVQGGSKSATQFLTADVFLGVLRTCKRDKRFDFVKPDCHSQRLAHLVA